MTKMHDAMRIKLDAAVRKGRDRRALAFRIGSRAMDRLCLEVAHASDKPLSRAPRPKHFYGVRIIEIAGDAAPVLIDYK